jgi:hypothetical protein
VIRTKLLPPSPRFEEVPRPELLARLQVGSVRELTLIGAPAGYGKTTLLNQWRRIEEPDLPFAWVTLDKQDNDPARLWKLIFEALRGVAPGERLRTDALASLGMEGTNLVETVLPALINDDGDRSSVARRPPRGFRRPHRTARHRGGVDLRPAGPAGRDRTVPDAGRSRSLPGGSSRRHALGGGGSCSLYPDAGIFPEHLERQERILREGRTGSMDGRLTERELELLRLLHTKLSVSELGVSSRKEAVEQAYARKLI